MKVTSLEFQREFGLYRTLAQREPVIITNRGRDDVVLIAIQDFEKIRRYLPQAFYISELPRNVLKEFGSVAIPAEAAVFDDEYKS